MSAIEAAKEQAARSAVRNHVNNGDVVGVGSGSTIVYAVKMLKELQERDGLRVKCIPTSFQARQLILENGLELTSLEVDPVLNVAIDGADEADRDLTLIKGGGGCLAQEKVVAGFAKEFVVIADYRKRSARLGTSWKYVPIEVLPLAYVPVKLKIETNLGGKAELRMAKSKAGPVVTDNGCFLLDWHFDPDKMESYSGGWKAANDWLLTNIPGILDTGLFVGMAKKAYFGLEDGTVEEVSV